MKVKELIAKLQEFDGELEVSYPDDCDNDCAINYVEKTFSNLDKVYLREETSK